MKQLKHYKGFVLTRFPGFIRHLYTGWKMTLVIIWLIRSIWCNNYPQMFQIQRNGLHCEDIMQHNSNLKLMMCNWRHLSERRRFSLFKVWILVFDRWTCCLTESTSRRASSNRFSSRAFFWCNSNLRNLFSLLKRFTVSAALLGSFSTSPASLSSSIWLNPCTGPLTETVRSVGTESSLNSSISLLSLLINEIETSGSVSMLMLMVRPVWQSQEQARCCAFEIGWA